MSETALDNRVDNRPGGTCLVLQAESRAGRPVLERQPAAHDPCAMALPSKGMQARAADVTGGVLCRPPSAPDTHYTSNRGVSDPPISAAGPFDPRPRRVAHAPIPCPVRAADPGPARVRLSVHRGCPLGASLHAGTIAACLAVTLLTDLSEGHEPWL